MLLDDVMSELDAERRELLARELSSGGQSVIATTDLAHVPGGGDRGRPAAHLVRHDPSGGDRGMSRPRTPPISTAAGGARPRGAGPATTLAQVQEVWERAAGAAMASAARPTAEHGGVLTVTCSAAVWAQELDLMSEQVVARLNSALDAELISELRCRTG